jgi:signal transduction histidine kinase
MKIRRPPRGKDVSPLAERYDALLRDYLRQPDESALRQAYEFGRQSLKHGTSLIELTATHQHALFEILRGKRSRETSERILRFAGDFLAEVLSPYEMAHRGFHEAVSALRRMNELLEEEIKRIAFAVHDEAGQVLVAVHLALAELARTSSPDQKQQLEHINLLLQQVETQLRQYSHELRPTVLDDLGLIPAIRLLAGAVSARTALPIHVSAELANRLAPATEIALYRIAQEALNNAAKHARASSISIEISEESNGLLCRIQDDGVGFDPKLAERPGPQRGLGLSSMKERLNAIGGTFEIDSIPGRGTRILLRVPSNTPEVKHARSNSARG